MEDKIKDRLYHIVFGGDLTSVRCLIALSEYVWALSLWWPGETFSRSRTYHGMEELATENTWAIIFFISAVIQTYIVFAKMYHTKLAVVFATINSTLWCFVALSLCINVTPPNGVLSGDWAIFAGSIWVLVRSGYIPRPIRGVKQWI